MRVRGFVGDPDHFAGLHLDPPASEFDRSGPGKAEEHVLPDLIGRRRSIVAPRLSPYRSAPARTRM
jgi:hypothetical protein